MSEHLQRTIDDLTAKRDKLSEVIASLEWFKVEFPHTAAGLVAAPQNGKTGDRKPVKPRAKGLPDDAELMQVGDQIVAALRQKNPQRTGDLIKAAKLKVERNKLGRMLVRLTETGRITRAGAGRGATVALPGKSPARGGL